MEDRAVHLDAAGAGVGLAGRNAAFQRGGRRRQLEHGADAVRRRRPVQQRGIFVFEDGGHVVGRKIRPADHGADFPGRDFQNHDGPAVQVPVGGPFRKALDAAVQREDHAAFLPRRGVGHRFFFPGQNPVHRVHGVRDDDSSLPCAELPVEGLLDAGGPLSGTVQRTEDMRRGLGVRIPPGDGEHADSLAGNRLRQFQRERLALLQQREDLLHPVRGQGAVQRGVGLDARHHGGDRFFFSGSGQGVPVAVVDRPARRGHRKHVFLLARRGLRQPRAVGDPVHAQNAQKQRRRDAAEKDDRPLGHKKTPPRA